MRRRELLWGAVGLVTLGGSAMAQEAPKRPKGTLQAERAGWMLGMYVGEEKGLRYPFVTQLDPKGEAATRGLRAGDELMRVDDEEVNDLGRLHRKIIEMRVGDRVEIWVRRGSQTLRFELRVPKNHAPLSEEAQKAEEEKAQAKKAADAKKSEEKKKSKKKRGPVIIKPIDTGS